MEPSGAGCGRLCRLSSCGNLLRHQGLDRAKNVALQVGLAVGLTVCLVRRKKAKKEEIVSTEAMSSFRWPAMSNFVEISL